MVPAALTFAIPDGAEVVGLVSLQRQNGRIVAVSQPVAGHPTPKQTPDLLRWLADLIELDLLDEVPDRA